MRIKKKLHSVTLTSMTMILFLIIISSTVSAATAQSSSPIITEVQVTNSLSDEMKPVIYGDKITWMDFRNKKWDICIFDLSSHEEICIPCGLGADPVIYGNRIVWFDYGTGKSDIYMYDLSTSQKTQITTSGDASYPKIYGNRIVWIDQRNIYDDLSGYDVYLYDLSSSKETQLSKTGSAGNPSIYSDKVVWFDSGDSSPELNIYNLSTQQKSQIPIRGTASNPSIYGDKVVYEISGSDYKHSNIYIYNLSTKKQTQISYSASAFAPSIYGNRIVWTDIRNGNYDIYMYDLSTSTETQITTNESDQLWPTIYGDKLVWQDYRNGNDDIYMCTIVDNKVAPVADFSATPISGNVPLKVKFTSTSTGSPTEWKWSFGDGSTLVTEQNPEHTYSKAGIYTVKHTAINAYGRSTEIKTNYITVKAAPVKAPVAAFSASSTLGKVPLKVQFTDKSTNSPTSWKWSFGDGTYSTSKSPSHTYSKAGKYTVSLTVKNAAGINTKTIKNCITVNAAPVKPVAAFSASPTSGYAPLKVTFTDKSANSPTSWKWSFGDGKTSTSKSPAYTYSKAGKYTVSLTVKNAAGSSTKTIKNYIVVNTLKAPVASFSAKPTSGKAPLNVQFTDKSSNNPTSWKWTFGDGTDSTSRNPVHKYSKVGKYTTSLTVKNAKGSNTKTISNYIIVKKEVNIVNSNNNRTYALQEQN